MKTCPVCNGYGFLRTPLDSTDPGRYTRCAACEGTGEMKPPKPPEGKPDHI